MSFDYLAVRSQFPVLTQTLRKGLRPVFLDSGASAQKPATVIAKEREVEEQYFANAYRGRYLFGARVDDEMEAARGKVAEFIGAPSSEQVAFVPGATAGLNMVAFGWAKKHIQPGDEILITLMEHHANFVPWQQVAQERGALLRFIPLTPDGRLDLDRIGEVLSGRTRVIAVCGMSNVFGTINPVRKLADLAHSVGAVLVVDGAQSVPHLPSRVIENDIDFLVFSGHKLYGPTGVGVLYGKQECLNELEPTVFGGHMIERVWADRSTWARPPARFEAGTLPIVQAIGLGAAIDWVNSVGLDAMHHHEQSLLLEATRRLGEFPGIRIFGPAPEHKGAILSFRFDDVHPEDLAVMLDRRAVFTRHGHHCTMPLHDYLGVSATTRVSFAAYNGMDDVDALADAIQFAREKLGVSSA